MMRLSLLLLSLLAAVVHSATGIKVGGWISEENRASKHHLFQKRQHSVLVDHRGIARPNVLHNIFFSSPSTVTTVPTTMKDTLASLRGGGTGESKESNDEENDTTSASSSSLFKMDTFPPSWLTHTTTGAMCTGFMCYSGLSLILFPQKVMASYGIEPTTTVESEGDSDDTIKQRNKRRINQKNVGTTKEGEEERVKEIPTDISVENKLLRMIGSIEFGLGLLVYFTVLPKRDLFADWTLQQVLAFSLAPRFVVSFCSSIMQMLSSLFSSSAGKENSDADDVVTSTVTTLKKEKAVLLSMNAPFLLFVIVSLIINPASKEWSAYPSIVAKVFSVIMALESIQFLLRPNRASQRYFQVDMDDDDKKHAKALTRALANDLTTTALYFSCLSWNIFDGNAPKIAGYVSLLYVILLFDMGYISKTWKLMNEKAAGEGGPWVQNVHIVISLLFATGFLLS